MAGGAPLRGHGQTVAIIDSGIDFSHEALAHADIAGTNFDCLLADSCPPNPDPDGNLFHGTYVAGIVAARSDVMNGMAPDANLIGLRIYDGTNGATSLHALRAFNWCVEHASEYDIGAINVSLGASVSANADCDTIYPPLTDTIETLAAQGIVVSASAGNSGHSDRISYPACMPTVIGVGATNKDDTVWINSNYGPALKLFAVGASVWSTCPRAELYCGGSGTSAAAPMVAGAVALMRQLLDVEEASLTPAEYGAILFETGDPVVDLPFDQWRRINVGEAVATLIDAIVPVGDVNIDGVVDTDDLTEVILNWGACEMCPPVCFGDLNDDCMVDVQDLVLVLQNWG